MYGEQFLGARHGLRGSLSSGTCRELQGCHVSDDYARVGHLFSLFCCKTQRPSTGEVALSVSGAQPCWEGANFSLSQWTFHFCKLVNQKKTSSM